MPNFEVFEVTVASMLFTSLFGAIGARAPANDRQWPGFAAPAGTRRSTIGIERLPVMVPMRRRQRFHLAGRITVGDGPVATRMATWGAHTSRNIIVGFPTMLLTQEVTVAPARSTQLYSRIPLIGDFRTTTAFSATPSWRQSLSCQWRPLWMILTLAPRFCSDQPPSACSASRPTHITFPK